MIGLGMHNYELANGQLPKHAIYDKDGRPLLSWRVAILPYLDEDGLYREFKLDEPWDSPHNQKLLLRMPKAYVHPNKLESAKSGLTYFQAFVGEKQDIFHPVFVRDGPAMTLAAIPDGPRNTVLVVEASNPVPWTKPDDLPYSSKQPLPPLGGLLEGNRVNMLFADGSVRTQDLGALDERTLRAIITTDDGVAVNVK